MRIAVLALVVTIAGEAPESCCEGNSPPPTATGPTGTFGTDLSGGRLEGTLDLRGSPYRVRDDVFVPSTGTLTIEPGVVMEFYHHPEASPLSQDSKTRLLVFGNVMARGTKTAPITFTAANREVGWWGIVQNTDTLSNAVGQRQMSTRPSVYDHVIIEYARKDGEWWADSGPRPFSRGGGLNINLTGIESPPGQITIMNSIFRHNFARESCGAVDLMTVFSAVFSDNLIEDNEARDFGGGGVCLSHGTGTKVQRNLFRNNRAANPAGGEGDISGGGGLDLIDANDDIIEDNRFENNRVSGAYAPGSAILVWTAFATTIIRNNVFIGNVADASMPGAVYLLDPHLMTVIGNDFSGNEAPWVVNHPLTVP